MSIFFHKSENPLFHWMFELFLTLRALLFIGGNYSCPCCGWKLRTFITGGSSMRTRDLGYCPRCNSKSRHRRDWQYFVHKTNLISDQVNLFHVSPKYSFSRKFVRMDNIHYFGVDLSFRRNVSAFMDITACSFRSEFFDAAICIHVLEEIQDDKKAMHELYRILKPGGWAFITVPIQVNHSTYEDPNITSPQERKRAFGESAHVRIYGMDLKERLEHCGFNVEIDRGSDIPEEIQKKFGLKGDENIFFCTK